MRARVRKDLVVDAIAQRVFIPFGVFVAFGKSRTSRRQVGQVGVTPAKAVDVLQTLSAGVEGIGPSSAVLETAVLPLNDTPISTILSCYCPINKPYRICI